MLFCPCVNFFDKYIFFSCYYLNDFFLPILSLSLSLSLSRLRSEIDMLSLSHLLKSELGSRCRRHSEQHCEPSPSWVVRVAILRCREPPWANFWDGLILDFGFVGLLVWVLGVWLFMGFGCLCLSFWLVVFGFKFRDWEVDLGLWKLWNFFVFLFVWWESVGNREFNIWVWSLVIHHYARPHWPRIESDQHSQAT